MMATLAGLFSRQMAISAGGTARCAIAQSSRAGSEVHCRTLKTLRTATGKTWGGGKQKTHSGTAKRFAAIKKSTGTTPTNILPKDPALRQMFGAMVLEGALPSNFLSPRPQPGMSFKRGSTGMRHLNSKMTSTRKRRLRGTTAVTHPSHIKALRRLLGKRART